MTIQIAAQRTALCTAYATAAPNMALHTGSPGTSGNATNEVTGGSPAYARKSCGWGTASASVVTGTEATFDVPASTTVTHVSVTVSSTAATNDVRDWVAITSQTFASQGQLKVTPTYTQS